MPLDQKEPNKTRKAQVAVDFLTSYGIAILIMLIAIAVTYKISTGTTALFSSQCTPNAGFSCRYYSLTNNGVLTLGMGQATGAAILVNGIACSQQAASDSLPAHGNLFVTGNSLYYPSNSASLPATIQSGGQQNFNLYCYTTSGVFRGPGTGGSQYVGYIWLNYTIQNTNINNVQQVAGVALLTIPANSLGH